MTEKPNILLVVVDCLRSDAVFGGPMAAPTPAIDALAARGAAFPTTITAATYTTPSFCSILTGLYPSAHGVQSLGDHVLPGSIPTLATILEREGYCTFAHVTGPLGAEIGMHRGFDVFERRNHDEVSFGTWGRRFLAEFPPAQEPWFMLLHLWEPHLPRYVAPGCDRPQHGAGRYQRAVATADQFVGRVLERCDNSRTLAAVTGDHGERVTDCASDIKGRLMGRLRRLKDAVPPLRWLAGRVKKSRLTPQRFLAAAAEHGDGVRDVLAKVPMVLAGPGVTPARRFDGQVRTIDLMPSLLELAGATHGQVQGRSLLPLLEGSPSDEPPALVEASRAIFRRSFAPRDIMVGYRSGGYKCVFAPADDGYPRRLYDLQRDPEEKTDVADRRPDLAARLEKAARQELATGEPYRVETNLTGEADRRVVEKRLRDLGYLG